MTRTLARIATAVAVVATIVATTATAASAAPTGFSAEAVHAGGAGAIATATNGNIGWSTSFKTVTVSNVQFFVKGGECANFQMKGYQGSTAVTPLINWPADGSNACPAADHWYSIGTLSATATVPGGVTDLIITVTDRTHGPIGYADCFRTESSCRTGQI